MAWQAEVRGAVRGAAAPLNLGSLAGRLGLEAQVAAGHMLGGLLEELAAAGAVAGALQAGATVWTPAIHSRSQTQALHNFYRYSRDLFCLASALHHLCTFLLNLVLMVCVGT